MLPVRRPTPWPLHGVLVVCAGLLSACAVGVVKDAPSAGDADTEDTGTDDVFEESPDPGAPPPVQGCTLSGERDDGVDGELDLTSETTWLDRLGPDGQVYLTDYVVTRSLTGDQYSRTVRYDDNLCITSDTELTTSGTAASGTRTTSACDANGRAVETEVAVRSGPDWVTRTTTTYDYVLDADGRVESVVVETDNADPATPDSVLLVEYTYSGDQLVALSYFLGPDREPYYDIEYTYDSAGNPIEQLIILGDYFGAASGDVYLSVERTFDDRGNVLVTEQRSYEGALDRTEATWDTHDRLATYDRDEDSTGIRTRSETVWDPDLYRQLENTYTDDVTATNSYTATRSFSGTFPWTETIEGTATDGGLDFRTVATYTCPDAPSTARRLAMPQPVQPATAPPPLQRIELRESRPR